MSRRRQVNEEERALWRHVTRTVKPLGRHRKDAAAVAPQAEAEKKPVRPQSVPRPNASMSKSVAKPAPKSAAKSAPKSVSAYEPALAPLDRRARQRLARGTQEIDGRLDLHGRSQSEAHTELLRFLHRAQADGAKMVLVITGKGGVSSAGERGVLKRHVPMWLALPEFRGLVVGFGPAAIGHGGEGALYVRVRRGRA
jgi:DNA-nicking Smr family endonuclease